MSMKSLLFERAVFRGHETVNTAIAVAVLATNTTPDEFIRLIDKYSSAIALWDRIARKVFVANKATHNNLVKFLKLLQLGFVPELSGPLSLSPLGDLLDRIVIPRDLQKLAADIITATNDEKLRRHNKEHAAYQEGSLPHFYEPSSAESDRSAVITLKSWKANYLVRQLVAGKKYRDVFKESGSIDLRLADVVDLGRALIGRSPYVDLVVNYKDGVVYFDLYEKDWRELEKRMADREIRTLKDYHWEAGLVRDILNKYARRHLESKAKDVLEHPELFPTEFQTDEDRVLWLKAQGFTDIIIRQVFERSQRVLPEGMDL